MYRIKNMTSDKHKITEQRGMFSILEHNVDYSVSPASAANEYFMAQMGVRRRQVIAQLNGQKGLVLQAGAMQWTTGNLESTTGVKGAGDFFGKMLKSAVTNESVVKPTYKGTGILATEPTYKFLLTENVADWAGGLVLEDGMFLACEDTVTQEVQARSNASSALLGKEGLFNLKLTGDGACVLESNVPRTELVEVELENDVLKIDGSYAVCWSGSLQFTVERSSKTLIGSAASGEGLVNVYRGTGRVLMAPLSSSQVFQAAAIDDAE